MAELTHLMPLSEEAVAKANLWTSELFTAAYFDEMNDVDDIDGYTMLRFYTAALDALGQSSVVKPEIMQGLQPNQRDDIAIYYALTRAADFRSKLEQNRY